MPLYNYQCLDCGAQDPRLGGLDDHCATCYRCGGLMIRLTDPFAPLRLGENPDPEGTLCRP